MQSEDQKKCPGTGGRRVPSLRCIFRDSLARVRVSQSGYESNKTRKQEIVLDSVTSEATVSSIGSRLRLRTYGADAPVKFVNGLFGWV